MSERDWGEITGLVGQGNVGEVISLLRVSILICKMRQTVPTSRGLRGMAASVGAQQTRITAVIIIVA